MKLHEIGGKFWFRKLRRYPRTGLRYGVYRNGLRPMGIVTDQYGKVLYKTWRLLTRVFEVEAIVRAFCAGVAWRDRHGTGK